MLQFDHSALFRMSSALSHWFLFHRKVVHLEQNLKKVPGTAAYKLYSQQFMFFFFFFKKFLNKFLLVP